MSDTESFESVMEVAKTVSYGDCGNDYLDRCERFCDDCHECIKDILAHLKAAHDREIRDVSQREFARGMDAGKHSMDAEHRAVAMRLRHLPLDGGSHENLSQIARAIWHSDFGWTQGACASLRDKLIDLMGGVSDGDLSKSPKTIKLSGPTADLNHGNAEMPSITEVGDDTCGAQCGGTCAAGDDCDSVEPKEVDDGGRDSGKSSDVPHGGRRGIHRLSSVDRQCGLETSDG